MNLSAEAWLPRFVISHTHEQYNGCGQPWKGSGSDEETNGGVGSGHRPDSERLF